jgi:Ethanolamine utilization protein EutJ (predicted chaperonin)
MAVINANQSGDANYFAATEASLVFEVLRGNQAIIFNSSPPTAAVVGGPAYKPSATSSSGLPVTFSIDPSSANVASVNNGVVTFIGPGTAIINANQSGNANYNPAIKVSQSISVGKGSQTISFTSTPTNIAVGGASYRPTASSTSGLPVTFSIDPLSASVATISNGTVTFIGAGTAIINANQSGNATYNAAPKASQSFTVIRGNQRISFTSLPPTVAVVGGPTYKPTAVSTSGLPVMFSIDPSSASVATISGGAVTFIGAGTAIVNANQTGNVNYNSAPKVSQSITVGKGNQTISFTSIPTNTVVGGTYSPTASSTSGLPVTFSIDPSSATIASISNGIVTFIGVGTATINAHQPGNVNYNAAVPTNQKVTVSPSSQMASSSPVAPTNLLIERANYTSELSNDLESTSAITFYPNPARDRLFIKSAGMIKGIVSMDGRFFALPVFSSEDWKEIDVTSLSEGLYLILMEGVSTHYKIRFTKVD